MKRRILDILVCPNCGRRLNLMVFREEKRKEPSPSLAGTQCSEYCSFSDIKILGTLSDRVFDCRACYSLEVVAGLLRCDCREVFPIVRGVPRVFSGAWRQFQGDFEEWRSEIGKLLPPVGPEKTPGKISREVEQTKNRFEFQWLKWGRGEKIFGRNKEQMIDQLTEKLDISYYPGKLVLDGGCGHGRYVDCFQELGAEAVGMDLGEGIDIAYERYGHLPRAHFIQADILNIPLREKIFDFVFSFGVIHHTPSSRAAFVRLAGLVASGGRIMIWVYPKEAIWWEVSQKFIRSITTRLPPRILYYLCFLPVPLLGLKTYSGTNLSNSSWGECAQVVWDWYSPKYQFHHSRPEVQGWFEAAGFGELEFLSIDVGMIGVKK